MTHLPNFLPYPATAVLAVEQIADLVHLADNLGKTKITGDKNVDAIQDGVNTGVAGQFGKGGLLEGVGNMTSKEVFTRSERDGKGDKGGIQ